MQLHANDLFTRTHACERTRLCSREREIFMQIYLNITTWRKYTLRPSTYHYVARTLCKPTHSNALIYALNCALNANTHNNCMISEKHTLPRSLLYVGVNQPLTNRTHSPLFPRYGSRIDARNGANRRRSARPATRTIRTCPAAVRAAQPAWVRFRPPPSSVRRCRRIRSRISASAACASHSMRSAWRRSAIRTCRAAPCYRRRTCINFIGECMFVCVCLRER